MIRAATIRAAVCAGGLMAPWAAVHAIGFELDYGDGISGTFNTVVTVGAGWRLEDRADDLVGKGNLAGHEGRDVCGPQPNGANFQSCQGVFRDQNFPAQALVRAPGQASPNFDDGNWNYDKGDITQAVVKITQDINATYGNYGLFVKWLYFYDPVNLDFTEYHPNRITRENREAVAYRGPERSNQSFLETFGRGAKVRSRREDGEVLQQIGTDFQLFDAYFYGSFDISDERSLLFKVGRQTVNWGESTVLVVNSVNQVNPLNVNNLYRSGFDLAELFIPTGMVFLSTELFEGATVEGYYGYEWEPVQIPAPGSYFSFVDVGTNNAINFASISFGTPPEDPDFCGDICEQNPESGVQTPLDNPLSGLTPTSLTIRRLQDNEPDGGQYGFALKYFAEWLNNGTEMSLYFVNYHSQFPLTSFYSTNPSCARAEGNALGLNASNATELLLACPDLPFEAAAEGRDPRTARSSAVPIDTVKFQLEYPENIQMLGVSFNTTVADWSIQGEVAYRPDMPVQVDLEDLTFHALGPMLGRCHDPAANCTGTTTGTGLGPNGEQMAYGSSDFVAYPGSPFFGNEYPDTFDLGVGHGVGSARSFPSFIGSWRGVPAGETPPNSYIRGWETFKVFQFNLGGTYVQGATDNFFGADQVIWLVEAGAQFVPDLPSTDRMQVEAFGTFYHASAGADGSMTGDYRQDCAHTPDCHFGPDGLRFNPHQQDHRGYPDDFSWGYAIVNLIRYESVFPGISFQPITIFQHDVQGTSVDTANQFIQNSKQALVMLETRWKDFLSFNAGYMWFEGGGRYNPWRDRDQALLWVKYQF